MIDWTTEKLLPYYDGSKRAHVRVVCDRCAKERWATKTNARQLESPNHLCVTCNSRQHVQDKLTKYADLPGMIRKSGTAYIPTACPACGKVRDVRANTKATLCRSCATRKRMKVGIVDQNGKTCPRCKQYKTFGHYYKDRSSDGGHSRYCKPCTKAHLDERGRAIPRAGLSRKQWREIKDKYENKCVCCKRSGLRLEADHITPIALQGPNTPENIQPLCRTCNLGKGIQVIDFR